MLASNIDELATLTAIKYEERGVCQHNILIKFLMGSFQDLSAKQCKMLSFYLKSLEGPTVISHSKQYRNRSFVFTNPEEPIRLTADSKIPVKKGNKVIYLDYRNYQNVQALGESTIEEQINFMHNSEFLGSVPKKKLFSLLRGGRILTYSFYQQVYAQGQAIEGGDSVAGTYLVRKGEFGYSKTLQKERKQLETLRFSKGHIFGAAELNNRLQPRNRAFTVDCRSHQGVVYCFSEQLFESHIKPYCEQYLNQRQNKLMKFLEDHLRQASKIRGSKSNFLSQHSTPRLSSSKTVSKELKNQFKKLPKTKQTQLESYKSCQNNKTDLEQIRKVNYSSLTKLSHIGKQPLQSQNSTHKDKQFRQFIHLEKSKEQCKKIRSLTFTKCPAKRGQIMFSFFKSTWTSHQQDKLESRYRSRGRVPNY